MLPTDIQKAIKILLPFFSLTWTICVCLINDNTTASYYERNIIINIIMDRWLN